MVRLSRGPFSGLGLEPIWLSGRKHPNSRPAVATPPHSFLRRRRCRLERPRGVEHDRIEPVVVERKRKAQRVVREVNLARFLFGIGGLFTEHVFEPRLAPLSWGRRMSFSMAARPAPIRMPLSVRPAKSRTCIAKNFPV